MLACSLLNRPSDWGPEVAAPHQKLLGNLICIAYSPPDIFLANANNTCAIILLTRNNEILDHFK